MNGSRRPAPSARSRQAAHKRGSKAERVAEWLLRCKGYRILQRRFTVSGGEIDIVAAKAGTVVFVEVKQRAVLGDAVLAIDAVKRRRMARAARVFLARHDVAGVTVRADAIYLAPWRWPLHIHAAFALAID